MDYTIKKRSRPSTIAGYQKDAIDLAYTFSKEAYKEFQPILKGIVLFGSAARRMMGKESDIDLLFVLDDVTIELTPELVETYKIICAKLVQKISPRIHVTTLKYTTFFEYVKVGDPIGLNILREGVALVDTGFFDPLQQLLLQGRLKPTFESVWQYYDRAQTTLHNSRWHVLRACEDLYWAVSDSAHAALMKVGVVAAAPSQLAPLLEEKLVKTKHIDAKHVRTMMQFFELYKHITHRTLKDVTGAQYEKYYVQARDFVDAMHQFLRKQ